MIFFEIFRRYGVCRLDRRSDIEQDYASILIKEHFKDNFYKLLMLNFSSNNKKMAHKKPNKKLSIMAHPKHRDPDRW